MGGSVHLHSDTPSDDWTRRTAHLPSPRSMLFSPLLLATGPATGAMRRGLSRDHSSLRYSRPFRCTRPRFMRFLVRHTGQIPQHASAFLDFLHHCLSGSTIDLGKNCFLYPAVFFGTYHSASSFASITLDQVALGVQQLNRRLLSSVRFEVLFSPGFCFTTGAFPEEDCRFTVLLSFLIASAEDRWRLFLSWLAMGTSLS